MSHLSPLSYVIGPEGERVTVADLPPAGTRRWGPRRKGRIVAAVEGGLITRDDARERYALSEEEYESWKTALTGQGLRGLRAKALVRQGKD